MSLPECKCSFVTCLLMLELENKLANINPRATYYCLQPWPRPIFLTAILKNVELCFSFYLFQTKSVFLAISYYPDHCAERSCVINLLTAKVYFVNKQCSFFEHICLLKSQWKHTLEGVQWRNSITDTLGNYQNDSKRRWKQWHFWKKSGY